MGAAPQTDGLIAALLGVLIMLGSGIAAVLFLLLIAKFLFGL